MSKVGTAQIGSRSIELYAFTGEVVDTSTSTHTEVTQYSNNQVQSYTSTNSQLFVKAKDGEEKALNVTDMGIGVRRGNTVSLIYAIKSGKDWGPYIAIYNHDTKSIHHIRKANNDSAGPPGYNMLLILGVIIGVWGGFGLINGNFMDIILLGAGCYLIYWIYMRQKKLMAAADAAARSITP